MNGHHVGDTVRVVTDAIERPTGTVVRGRQGKILAAMDGGYRVDFGNGLIADNVKPGEIQVVEQASAV